MPSFSSSCFCGLPALSCAGGAPSRAIGSRLRSSVLLAAATGGRGFNKARLKVRDFFLLCYLFATSLLLAGHGGEGMGWEAAVGSGAGGFCGDDVDSGRLLPLHLLAEGQLCWSLLSLALGASCCLAVPATLLAEGRPSVTKLAAGHKLQPPGLVPCRRSCCSVVVAVSHGALTVPSGFVPGDGEVDFDLPEGLDCVPKYVVEVLLVSVQGPVCNFFSCVGPDVSRVVSLA